MKKVLLVSEFSELNTGYSVYGKEVLSRLFASGKYEIAELACYINSEDKRVGSVPWKVYPNLPARNEKTEHLFNGMGTHAFGEYSFDRVCLEFKPDIVWDIRDFWMFEHQSRSPFRRNFRWAIMPTVDGFPQQEQWMHTFATADAVLTYQDWSGNVLKNQSGGRVKWVGSASPAASPLYSPLPNRDACRALLNMGKDVEVVGTVMRNQKRKLYPELFECFKRYLTNTGKKNCILYCHISYPDAGWDIPQLIKEFGLSSKVFLTYVCSQCQFAYPSTYQDVISYCPRCRRGLTHICNVNHGVSTDVMNRIYNMFDLYVQYANSEGFGMPQVEAAACGVPVAATDYSAMGEIVSKLKGYPIPVSSLYRELETGCNRARPDDDAFVEILTGFFNIPAPLREVKRKETRRLFEEHYSSWDKTAAKWMEVFDSLGPAEPWDCPPRIFQPAQPNDAVNQLNNLEFARWLIVNVLCEPERAGTYFESRIVRDLCYGVRMDGMGGLYYNEQAHMFDKPKFVPFNREIAYNEMVNLCNRRNHAEQQRLLKK
jgi:glycosyltransferase involved in cell wall biosynthesis